MKIYMITDLEGATGVCGTPQDFNYGGIEYEIARKMLTRDVNAAIEGAFEGGASEIIVLDGHGSGLNIIFEELDERVKLIRGRRVFELEGLDNSFNAVFFIGAHAMAGTQGALLPHTHSSAIANMWINGIKVGEIGLYAAIAGTFNIPMVLVTGDEAAIKEARSLLGDIEVVAVKKATSMYAAICLHPNVTYRLIKEAAKRALSRIKEIKPFKVNHPIEIRVEFTSNEFAERVAHRPGIKMIDGKTIVITADNVVEALSLIL